MARKERRLRPDLRHTRTSPSYLLFKQYHRHDLQNQPAFQPWDDKLQKLIEREGNGRGVQIDNPSVWSAFYTYFGEPIRDVFWAGWEDAVGLRSFYEMEAARIQMSRQGLPSLLRVANPAMSVDEDPAVLDGMIERVLEERGDGKEAALGPVSSDGRRGVVETSPPENRKAAG